MNTEKNTLERIETRLLLEGIYQHYGYDFRDYAFSTIRRRLWKHAKSEGLSTLSALQEKLLHDRDCFERMLLDLSVSNTSMFRDPEFYRAIRSEVVPLLRTYPFVRVWHAGCSTGEEVYSMAILLQEEGLLQRSRIYATDFNKKVLAAARSRKFLIDNVKTYARNYEAAGGKLSFSAYYTPGHTNAILSPDLAENISFLQHNLVTDHSFMEFNLILCRNVLMYFNRNLQNRVHGVLNESLCRLGILSLGKKESLEFTTYEKRYRELTSGHRIFRKIQ